MKRLLSWILCLCLMGMIFPVAAEEASPLEENGWQYRLIFDGTAVQITGYQGDETDLVVPDTIAGLPVWMVCGVSSDRAEKVTFLRSVRIIQNCFNDCPALCEVILPPDLFALQNSFDRYPLLAEVRLPAGLTHCQETFYGETQNTKLFLYSVTDMRIGGWIGQNREIIPYAYSPGDIDADNEITSTDARLALQLAVDKVSLTADQREAADVDGDGSVTSTDARLILQKAVGKAEGFRTRLIEWEPLFSIDRETARVTLEECGFPGQYQGELPVLLDNAENLTDYLQQAADGQRYAVQDVTGMTRFMLQVTWGEGSAVETVQVIVSNVAQDNGHISATVNLAYGPYYCHSYVQAEWFEPLLTPYL